MDKRIERIEDIGEGKNKWLKRRYKNKTLMQAKKEWRMKNGGKKRKEVKEGKKEGRKERKG